MSQLLERELVLDADVVAEEHRVQAMVERASRLAGGVVTVDRDDGQVGVAHSLGRRGDGSVRLLVLAAASRLRLEERLELLQRGIGVLRVRGLQEDHQVAVVDLGEIRRQEVQVAEHLLVHRVPIATNACSTPSIMFACKEMAINETESK